LDVLLGLVDSEGPVSALVLVGVLPSLLVPVGSALLPGGCSVGLAGSSVRTPRADPSSAGGGAQALSTTPAASAPAVHSARIAGLRPFDRSGITGTTSPPTAAAAGSIVSAAP
jgi:hypothetical protein